MTIRWRNDYVMVSASNKHAFEIHVLACLFCQVTQDIWVWARWVRWSVKTVLIKLADSRIHAFRGTLQSPWLCEEYSLWSCGDQSEHLAYLVIQLPHDGSDGEVSTIQWACGEHRVRDKRDSLEVTRLHYALLQSESSDDVVRSVFLILTSMSSDDHLSWRHSYRAKYCCEKSQNLFKQSTQPDTHWLSVRYKSVRRPNVRLVSERK